MAIVAQLGGGVVLGAGGYFLQFTAPELGRRRPLFLALAGGAAAGGSIGGTLSIPWSEIVRRLINRDAVPTPIDELAYAPLDGTFALRDIHGAQFSIVQVGAFAALVGVQIVSVECRPWQLFGIGGRGTYFTSRHEVPTSLPAIGRALVDAPQVQGGLGVVAAGFTGSVWPIG
jgi:hypothetical protein